MYVSMIDTSAFAGAYKAETLESSNTDAVTNVLLC
jgi:hypothetical protein